MPQFDFLTEYVLELLKANGFANLTDQQRNVYVPALLAQVQERLGAEFLPKLSVENQNKFAALVEAESVNTDEWKKFWYEAVPNFEEQLKVVLAGFAEEVKQILKG